MGSYSFASPKRWDRVEQKLECMRGINLAAKALDVNHLYVLGRIVNKYLSLDDEDEERFATELRQEQNQEVSEMVVTWEEALAEREVIGGLAATRKAIVLLARACKVEIIPTFEEKLDAISDLDRLYQILEQIPHVRSVAELDLD